MQPIPETPSEIAKRMWDTAVEHINAAANEEDIAVSNCYATIAQAALTAAQFALTNPGVILGIPDDNPIMYPGVASGSMGAVLPPGAPPLPTWGGAR